MKQIEQRADSTRDIIPELMPLDTAKEILRVVVLSNEQSLMGESDLSHVGIYTLQQVRTAMDRISYMTHALYGGETLDSGVQTVKKDTRYGILHLAIFQTINGDKGEIIAKNLTMNMDHLIETCIPLGNDNTWLGPVRTRFKDYRKGTNIYASMYNNGIPPTIETYKQIWKGMRWLCANMLSWQEKTILPEDLNNL